MNKTRISNAVAYAIGLNAKLHRAYGVKDLISKDEFEALSEEMQKLYVASGDDYLLDVEGKGSKLRLDEFRGNNIRLAKEKEELEAKLASLEGVDVEEYKRLKQEQEDLKDKKLLDEGKVDELIEQRTERMRAAHDAQVAKLNEALETARSSEAKAKEKLSEVLIDARVSEAITALGNVQQGAMADIQSRARNTWKLDEEGNPVAFDAAGNPRFGKDGKAPLTFGEWGEELLESAPFLFQGSTGAGGKGSDKNTERKTGGTIDARDGDAFLSNLEKIASGEKRATL